MTDQDNSINLQREIQVLKNQADLLSNLEKIKTISGDIQRLESELDKMNISGDKKADVIKTIDNVMRYCCKCGDMWAGDLPPAK